jgi:hypothetical protein
MSLETLKQVTPNFVRLTSEHLDHCGLHTLGWFSHRMLSMLHLVETKDEYASLLSVLAVYANRLSAWNQLYFPWHHGDRYKLRVVSRPRLRRVSQPR